jgi:hypothetical protein
MRVLAMMQAAGYALFSDEAAAVLLHDCGKLIGPGIFAENGGGARPKPWVLSGHVDHGAMIADSGLAKDPGSRLTGLQRRAIVEHHGTEIIQDEIRKDGEVIRKEIRYQGDRPGSLFTAVLNLADTMEAITAGQGYERARQLLGGICEKRIQDGQFDDVGHERVREAARRLAAIPELAPMTSASQELGIELDDASELPGWDLLETPPDPGHDF